jgi:hypothetical protein
MNFKRIHDIGNEPRAWNKNVGTKFTVDEDDDEIPVPYCDEFDEDGDVSESDEEIEEEETETETDSVTSVTKRAIRVPIGPVLQEETDFMPE